MKKKYVYLLTLRHVKSDIVSRGNKEIEVLPFWEKKACEKWLIKNGFVYGQSEEFKFIEGLEYWFHQQDTADDFVEVTIEKVQVMDEDAEPAKWIAELSSRKYKYQR